MRRVPTSRDLRAFINENSHLIADSIIRAGIREYDAHSKEFETVDDECTLTALRCAITDFLKMGCERKTYVLDINQAMGLPSWRYYSYSNERCYMTLYLGTAGSLVWRFTWTDGELTEQEEIDRIDLTFRRGLSGWAHVSTAGYPVKQADFLR